MSLDLGTRPFHKGPRLEVDAETAPGRETETPMDYVSETPPRVDTSRPSVGPSPRVTTSSVPTSRVTLPFLSTTTPSELRTNHGPRCPSTDPDRGGSEEYVKVGQDGSLHPSLPSVRTLLRNGPRSETERISSLPQRVSTLPLSATPRVFSFFLYPPDTYTGRNSIPFVLSPLVH